MHKWLSVIGIEESGWDGLDPASRRLIEEAALLIGGERHLAMIPAGSQGRMTWLSPLSDTVSKIAGYRGQNVVVLATGDPLWYGVGVTLLRHFPAEEVLVIPARSSFSVACAKMGWALAETVCTTLHGRKLESLMLHLAPKARLLILSHDGTTPASVARFLTAQGYADSKLTVLEHLDGTDEARHDGTALSWMIPQTRDLNIIAVECVAGPQARILPRLAGLPDDMFVHDGQMTKREARALALAALMPLPGQILWDIGAGCGSISVEWLRVAPQSQVFAIERDASRCHLIAQNAMALGVPHVAIKQGDAASFLDDLPAPDAIFLGGGLTEPNLAERSWRRLRSGGRCVAHAVTLEGEQRLLQLHKDKGGHLTRLAVSRAEPIGPYQGWRSLMPVTHWAAVKP